MMVNRVKLSPSEIAETDWWQNTKRNAQQICPEWFSENIGFSLTPIQEISALMGMSYIAGGARTSLKIIKGAGDYKNLLGLLGSVGHAWCIGSYIGGSIDASYQSFHENIHMSDDLASWYAKKEKGVENFLVHFTKWWEN